MPIPLIIALIFALGGGTSIAAEQALPGDILYPIKVHVNEQVRSAIAISDADQASWDAARTDRRLQEAETLAAKGTLNTATQAELASSINAHINAFNDVVKEMTDKQGHDAAASAEANLEATLSAHSQVLKALAAKPEGKDDHDALITLATNVDAYTQAAASTRMSDEATIEARGGTDAQNAAEGKLGAAQNKVDEVRSYIAKHSASVSAAMVASANTKLSDADQKIIDGKAKITAGAYTDAFDDAQTAMSTAQEAKVMISTGERLDVDLELGDDHEEGSSTEATSTAHGTTKFRVNVGGGDGNERTEGTKERDQEGDTGSQNEDQRPRGMLRSTNSTTSGIQVDSEGNFTAGI